MVWREDLGRLVISCGAGPKTDALTITSDKLATFTGAIECEGMTINDATCVLDNTGSASNGQYRAINDSGNYTWGLHGGGGDTWILYDTTGGDIAMQYNGASTSSHWYFNINGGNALTINSNKLVTAKSSLQVDAQFTVAGKSFLTQDVDISSGKYTGSMIIGADTNAYTRTTATSKIARIIIPHYTNSEPDTLLISANNSSGSNTIYIGGGNNTQNAATQIKFYTAANTTTLNGSNCFTLDSDGLANFNFGVNIAGDFTSLGIHDVATGERFHLQDDHAILGEANTTDTFDLLRGSAVGAFILGGGSSSEVGGNIHLSGETHATIPGDVDISFYTGKVSEGPKASALTLTVDHNVAVTNALIVSGAFTSLGIDDNATGERLQIADTVMNLGGAHTGSYGVYRATDDQSLIVGGGNGINNGSNITFYGGTHTGNAGDVALKSGGSNILFWDEDGGDMYFYTGYPTKVVALTINQNQAATFQANVVVNGVFISNGIEDNATETAITITAAENVGIGIGATTPEATMHAASTHVAGATAIHANYDDALIENNANTGLTIRSPDTNNAAIAFADASSNLQGAIIYTHTNDAMLVWTNNSLALTISSTHQAIFESAVDVKGSDVQIIH
jgi:hypothetical protein